jgi:hypothetical protein
VDLSSRNAGYILNAVDVFSRKMATVKLPSKNKSSIQDGFNKIFQSLGKPNKIQSDLEPAILSLEPFLKSKNIELYHVDNAYDGLHSAPIVERLNRTMKDYMYGLKQQNKNQNWNTIAAKTIKEFPDFYNNKVHRTTKQTPNEIHNKDININEVKRDEMERYNKPRKEPKKQYNIGDKVRLQIPQSIIEKKLEEKYYKEIYEIEQVLNTNPITYKLKGLEPHYYKQQLIKIDDEQPTTIINNEPEKQKPIKEPKPEPLYYKNDEVIYNGEKYNIVSSKFYNSKDDKRGFWYRLKNLKETIHERLLKKV